ncbi:hypothetical protein KL921_003265 [Ogataea angusta]|nr:hypothetical protein KL921_003265 [Ogataea angusta]
MDSGLISAGSSRGRWTVGHPSWLARNGIGFTTSSRGTERTRNLSTLCRCWRGFNYRATLCMAWHEGSTTALY